jgi:hypothetical protein
MNEPDKPAAPPADALSDAEIKRLLATSTLPTNLSMHLLGFQSKEDAEKLGEIVGSFLRLFGTFLNLERLDAVTVAYDYDTALKEVDRGTVCQEVTATNDTFARGVGMAVRVLRKGQVKSHIVVAAGLMNSLRSENDPNYQLAIGLLAHEAAHVHDSLMQDLAFPGVLLQRSTGFREGILLQMAQVCWDEYAACRLSTRIGDDKQLAWFEETFCSFAEEVRERTNKHIQQYRWHGDLNKLVPQVVAEYGALLKYAGYFLGHLDGLGLSIEKDAPKANEIINRKKYFTPIFEELVACLKSIWATYGHWPGLQIFDPLKNVADKLLQAGGIEIEDRASGAAYVRVPFSPETMPSLNMSLEA